MHCNDAALPVEDGHATYSLAGMVAGSTLAAMYTLYKSLQYKGLTSIPTPAGLQQLQAAS